MHNKKDNRIRKTAYMGLFLAVAMICSYIETLIPFSVGIPGIKLGLANIVVVLMLYAVGTKEALLVSVLRIVLVGILFGNAFSILYSLSGGILSFLVMVLLKKTEKFSCISVSITGGISHNIGQIIVAAWIVNSYNVFFYVPVLLFAGLVTGLLRDCKRSDCAIKEYNIISIKEENYVRIHKR